MCPDFLYYSFYISYNNYIESYSLFDVKRNGVFSVNYEIELLFDYILKLFWTSTFLL